MDRWWNLTGLLVIISIAIVTAEFAYPHENDCGPLCDYARKDDGEYSYDYVASKTTVSQNCTTYFFNLTSQRWRPDDSWADRPVWWHWVSINIPNGGIDLNFRDNSVMYVSTGNNNDMNGPSIGTRHQEQTLTWCQRTGMITAVIRQIPNQPIVFADDPLGRSRNEDSIIAYTWRNYLNQEEEDKDPEVVLRMPMCKAVSKAMTMVQDVVMNDPKGTGHIHTGVDIKKFLVAGESKRGWTTWMMPPMDSRVDAIAPVVLSCLNLMKVFPKYYMSLNGWPVAMGDYWLADIMVYMVDPKGLELAELVDPFAYKEWLDLPKFMVSAASDEFFMMDDYDFFYDELPGEKHMLLQENTRHSLNRGPNVDEFWRQLETFYIAVIQNYERPVFAFHRQYTAKGGSILVHVTHPVSYVAAWESTTLDLMKDRRDFRSLVLDPIIPVEIEEDTFFETPATNLGNGWYEAYFDNPPEGKYRAFFVKIKIPWPGTDREFVYTTKAMYLPDGYPFKACEGTTFLDGGCRGILR